MIGMHLHDPLAIRLAKKLANKTWQLSNKLPNKTLQLSDRLSIKTLQLSANIRGTSFTKLRCSCRAIGMWHQSSLELGHQADARNSHVILLEVIAYEL